MKGNFLLQKFQAVKGQISIFHLTSANLIRKFNDINAFICRFCEAKIKGG